MNIITSFVPKKINFRKIGDRHEEHYKLRMEISENAKILFPIWLKEKRGKEIDREILSCIFQEARSSRWILKQQVEQIEKLQWETERFLKRNKIGNKDMEEFWKEFYWLRFSGLLPLAIKRGKIIS